MKKVGDLFEELGFRKDGSEGVKRAFVENLVKAANQGSATQMALPLEAAAPKVPTKTPMKASTTKAVEQQLSFNFDALETDGPSTPNKRNAG